MDNHIAENIRREMRYFKFHNEYIKVNLKMQNILYAHFKLKC